MSKVNIPYLSVNAREELEHAEDKYSPGLTLNAWSVQNIVYEIIYNYGLANPPNTVGFVFNDRITEDKLTSGIYLDIAYQWDPKITQKRPAVFVQRGDMGSDIKQFAQTSFAKHSESETTYSTINNMAVNVKVIAPEVGACEQLAEYIRQPLIYFQQVIQKDFGFRQFRVKSMSKPEIYVEAGNHFVVVLTISTVFDEFWMVKADHLKLKSVSRTIFDSIQSKPLTNQ